MIHKPTCRWILTTNVECEYRQTHHYCPHPEHACDCNGGSAIEQATETGKKLANKAIQYVGQRAGMRVDQESVVRELCEVLRVTVEYVGMQVLPPLEGWAWYDAMVKYEPETAQQMAQLWAGKIT
jgi:hypothetical protein